MLKFLDKSYELSSEVRTKLKIIGGISVAMFLFILFFQPFEPEGFDYNNKLLVIAGFGVTTFLFIALPRVILPWFFPGFIKIDELTAKQDTLFNILIWVGHTLAYSFYCPYVAFIEMSFYMVFKIALLSLIPVIIWVLMSENLYLKEQLQMLLEKENKSDSTDTDNTPDKSSEVIEIFSENKSEKIKLPVNMIILIKSANNYVEIIYREQERLKKELIRNTLKNISDQLAKFPVFLRSHRSSIVNITYIAKLIASSYGYKLRMFYYDQYVPVSRQYLLKIKEATANGV